MTASEQQRIRQIAQQAVTLNTPPASTPAWRADVGFARAHSMRIWDSVAAIRAGKSKPADHRIPGIGGPDDKDHTIPPGRVKDPPDADDLDNDDDDEPEHKRPDDDDNDDDDNDDDACACTCEECRDGRCEDCSNPACDDPNCEHADSDDDDSDE